MASTSVSLTHLVRPPTIPSDGPPPLLILLHGVRSNEQDLFGLAGVLDGRFFVVSVRGPVVFAPGAYGWYHIEFTAEGPVHNPAEAERGRRSVERAIGEVIAEYGGDPERVYLMGFSQGAIMSLATAVTAPDKVAGAVLMSGRLLPEVPAEVGPVQGLEHLEFIVTHGRWDNVLGVEMGHEIRDFLATLPVKSEYHEYPMGHQVSGESLDAVSRWLTAQLDKA